jgi:hypothetical protein
MTRLKEVAKFACGAEAFHAFVHAYFWSSGTTLTVCGTTETSTVNIAGAIVNAVISMFLASMHGDRAFVLKRRRRCPHERESPPAASGCARARKNGPAAIAERQHTRFAEMAPNVRVGSIRASTRFAYSRQCRDNFSDDSRSTY